jgi:hypothetical protein
MQIMVTIGALLSCVVVLFGKVSAETIPDKVSEEKTTTRKVSAEKTIPGDVIFDVPINLTRLSPSLTKVAVTCMVGQTIDPKIGMTSSGKGVLSNRVELPVSDGQVVTTARVVIAVPATPLYKTGQEINYQCTLSALSSAPKAGSGWQSLGEKPNHASFQVSPTPVPITGTFTW